MALPRSSLAARRHVGGFTVIELMTTAVVLAVLFGLALPSLTYFLDDSARSQAAAEFTSSLARARSQAISSGKPVFVCPRASSADNTPACSTGSVNDWSNGLYVYTATAAGTGEFSDDRVLWEYAPTNSNIKITQFTLGTGTSLAVSPIKISNVGTTTSDFIFWRICRTRGQKRDVGSVAVISRGGSTSLEPTTSPGAPNSTACPT